jgi:hypothetical protein
MYELDHAKDQTMTALKLALANLVMWTRDTYFPTTYAHATWHRLAPFFRVPGRVMWGMDRVTIELRPFNDRRLTCDLEDLCQRVEAAQPRLPDGRSVVLWVASSSHPTGSAQLWQMAEHPGKPLGLSRANFTLTLATPGPDLTAPRLASPSTPCVQ